MASILTAGVICEETIFCLLDAQLGVMRRHWITSTIVGGTVTDFDVAQARDNAIATALKPCLATAAEFRGISWQQRWRPVGGFIPLLRQFGIGGQGVGTGAAGDPLPKQVSGVISLRTEAAGPKYRGRMYVPFPSEGANDADQKPSAAYVALLDTLGALWVGTETIVVGADSVDITPILWHQNDPVPPATTPIQPSYNIIEAATGKLYWGTQRRRGDYGATNVTPI